MSGVSPLRFATLAGTRRVSPGRAALMNICSLWQQWNTLNVLVSLIDIVFCFFVAMLICFKMCELVYYMSE